MSCITNQLFWALKKKKKRLMILLVAWLIASQQFLERHVDLQNQCVHTLTQQELKLIRKDFWRASLTRINVRCNLQPNRSII